MQNTIMQQRNKADELHAKNENVAMWKIMIKSNFVW
jgi:hypothetical protein